MMGVLSVLFLVSCKDVMPGYSRNSSGTYFRLLAIGDDTAKAHIGDFVTVDISYSTRGDSVFFSTIRKIQVEYPDYEGSIDDCFMRLSVDDSAEFILDALPFFEKSLSSPLPSFLDSSSQIKVYVKVLDIQTHREYIRQKEEFLAWVSDFKHYEQLFLKRFIEQESIQEKPSSSGMYRVLKSPGNGAIPQRGDTVHISYTGRFLNGVFFDGELAQTRDFEFVLGTEWQVIAGIEEAIPMMKEGETSVFIMPSGLAWADKGSGADIVPPYTSVIFEITLNKVGKSDSLTIKTIL